MTFNFQFVESRDLFQISDAESLKKLCEDAILETSKAVQDYKKGKERAFHSIMSVISKKSKEKADMAKAAKILKDLLEK